MALLTLESGKQITALSQIEEFLSDLEIEVKRWPVPQTAQTLSLIESADLDASQKETLLKSCDQYFEQLAEDYGYQSRDLIVLHPETPQLEQALKKFEAAHTHADDEVRYIVDGEGVFGFVMPDGSQVKLQVEREEYINIPQGTEHWFVLTDKKRIKAIRYFSGTEGWTPEYTGTKLKL